MAGSLNRTIQLTCFGGPDCLKVVETPIPVPAPGELRVRVLASSINYTEVLIRKHLYPQTSGMKPPFVMGYDVVGEVDSLGEGVSRFRIGDRVAAMTVTGSNADYRILTERDVITPVPHELDPAEAATLILSWMTAYQLLHRSAKVRRGQRVLVHGAAGAVGQALLVLGNLAGLELWGAVRSGHETLIRQLGATPIDYGTQDFATVVPGGFDVIFDGIGEDAYRHSLQALSRNGLLIAIGFSAGVQAKQGMFRILVGIGLLYLRQLLPAGKRARFFSINAMQFRHPQWYVEDLTQLFTLLQNGEIHPQVAERISFDRVAEAHRRIEQGGTVGKVILCPTMSR